MKNAAKQRNRRYNLAALEAAYIENYWWTDDNGEVHVGSLTDAEKAQFDALMDELIKHMKLIPGRNNDHINELRWQNLSKFLADKKIKTFIERWVVTNLIVGVGRRLRSILRS